MKRFWAFIVSLVLIAGIVVAPVQPASAASVKVKKIKLNETAVTLTITEKNSAPTVQLKATISPKDASNKEVTWKSSDKGIAKVSKKGLVTALKAGKVTITCKAADGSGKKATCEITVKVKKTEASNETDKAKPKKIKITGSKYVAKGKKITLKATITPAKASQKVTWKSSDKKIATVSAKGVVKGIKPGKVTITATSKANKKITKSFKIEVKAKAVKKVTISGRKDLDLAGTKTVTLKAKASPKQAAQSFEWKSSDTKVATVNEKGKVTAKGVGTVKITATATDGSKKKKTVTIKVTNSGAAVPVVASTWQEANAALVDLISTYDGNIPSVPGYEEYYLARLLVKLKSEIPDISSFEPVAVIAEPNFEYIIQFADPVKAKNCCDFLNSQQNIVYSEADGKSVIDSEPVSGHKSYSYKSWGVKRIRADRYVQDLLDRHVSTSLTVAVFDSGIDRRHSLFSGRVDQGHDYVNNDDDPQDDQSDHHGTHVSGIIMDCTRGTNIRVLPIKIANSYGSIDNGILKQAINAVVSKGSARVINMSFHIIDDENKEAVLTAINNAIASGITVVVASGNDKVNTDSVWPANLRTPGCITVTGVDVNNNGGYFNYGEAIDLCAPGVKIVSAGSGGLDNQLTGSSQATPHVAAAAALLICDFPRSSPQMIEDSLKKTAYDLGTPGEDIIFGAGLVDLTAYIQNSSAFPKVEINETNFPDPHFRTIVKNLDLNEDGLLIDRELTDIEIWDLSKQSISDLKGIEHFTELKELICSDNHLSSVDLSGNTQLKSLSLSRNRIAKVDLSSLTELSELYCNGNNSLNELDTSRLVNLTILECADNQLSSLELSQNKKLETLVCNNNIIEKLDLSNNKKLEGLQCNSNIIDILDVSNAPLLTSLVKNGERIIQEDQDLWNMGQGPVLIVDHKTTVISGDMISGPTIKIDSENFPDENFRQFIVDSKYDKDNDNWLSDVEIKRIKDISCPGKSIKNLKGIEHFSALGMLNCLSNQLSSLDISKNTALTEVWCASNNLTKLDTSNNTLLRDIDCTGNSSLSELQLSKNTSLEYLRCANCRLSSLDISKNKQLFVLDCHGNSLSNLDVTNATKLASLVQNGTRITDSEKNYDKWEDGDNSLIVDGSVTVKAGGSTSNPTDVPAPIEGIEISADNFPDEIFRQFIIDSGYDRDGNGWMNETELKRVKQIYVTSKDISDLTGIEYFSSLTLLECSSNNLTCLDISKNTALTVLYCNNNSLTELDVSKNTSLTALFCNHNQLTSLDVTKNTLLTDLDCIWNELDSLDVSNNLALKYLSCDGNKLTSLNLSANTALGALTCANNNLADLDVSKNELLSVLVCSYNQLSSIDLTHNSRLYSLYCESNRISNLNISHISGLSELRCFRNRITEIDVSNCSTIADRVTNGERLSYEYGDYDYWASANGGNNVLLVDPSVIVHAGDTTSYPREE